MMQTIRGSKRGRVLFGLFLLLLISLISCGESPPDDPAEYALWIENPEKGLIKEKTTDDVQLAVTYQPPQYLAMKDAGGSESEYRALLKRYANGMSFVIRVDTKEGGGDIMGKGLGSYDDYRDRVTLLNFGIKDYVQLKTSDTTLAPVLGTMENTYGLMTGRKLLVVFQGKAPELLKGEQEFEIIFADPVFGTGVNRFRYRVEDILKAPAPNV